jgi:hypothetical protein
MIGLPRASGSSAIIPRMLIAYLDQKDWIALLKADAGKPERPTHSDVLTLLRAAVDAGKVSLPLSHVHYQETSHRKPFAKRVQLAELMSELSRLHTIAPFNRLTQDEMRHFIATNAARFDGSTAIASHAPPIPFGRGGDHAFGSPIIADGLGTLKVKFRPLAAGVDEVVDSMSDVLELGLLAGHPDHDTGPAPADRLRNLQADEARRREDRRQARLQHGGTKGGLSYRTRYATAYYEKQDDILEALADIGVTKMPGNDVAIAWFIENVSTLYCDYELSRLKEEATNRPWTENDVRDVWALCAAIVYADVVVTEKQWAELANRELAGRYQTVVLSDVAQLINPILATT